MYRCMIFLHRKIEEKRGQHMLDAMAQQIKAQKMEAGQDYGRLALEGVTRHKSDFPSWLDDALRKAEFYYDDFNFAYQRDFKTRPDADKCKHWFDTIFRPFYDDKTEEQKFIVSCLAFQIMSPDHMSENMDTF